MIRKLFQLAVFLLIVNAVYQVAPVGLHFFEFKDAVEELALFSQKSTDQALVDRVMGLAEENHIPRDRDYVEVRRTDNEIIITASYVESLRLLPGYEYSRQFDVVGRAFTVKEPPGR